MRQKATFVFLFTLLFLLSVGCGKSHGYGVLTHQAIIDVTWKDSLVPVLKKKFPKATDEEMKNAYAFAYGGAIIQDMGYFPFGNSFFTDLTHYTRSGDFITALLEEAETLDEYAFALGALAHYYADNYGHPIGTNRAVPMVYPEVKAEHGNIVTYEEDPVAHVKMEFGFDVLQVARGNYAPDSYRNFIGFEVSKELLERAFLKTYGLELKSLFLNLDLTITTFRKSVSSLIPNLTKAAWNFKASEIQKAQPSTTRRNFQYRLRNSEFHKTWGREYQKPDLLERILSWFLRILPKIGPNRTLAFDPPTPEAEKAFMESFNVTAEKYKGGLKQVIKGESPAKNTALDTGEETKSGVYQKADETYAELLDLLAKGDFKEVSPELKKNILAFYATGSPQKTLEAKEEKELKKVNENLKALKETQLLLK